MRCFKPYDVFISHAAEDKQTLADEITQSLRRYGLRVWYSSDQLILGESIVSNVGEALRQCRYGVVILSQAALQSSWIQHELYSMQAIRNKNKTTIIPIWHDVTSEQVKQKVPGIADTYSLSTNEGLDVVISRLKEEIGSRSRICSIFSLGAWIVHQNRKFITRALITALGIVCFILFYFYINSANPPRAVIDRAILTRIHSVNREADKCINSGVIQDDSILTLRKQFDQISSHYNRHTFEFSGLASPLHSKVKLKQAGVPIELANVYDAYGFKHFTTCLCEYSGGADENLYFAYSFVNNDSVMLDIIDARHLSEDIYEVTVCYTNFIRAVYVSCSYDRVSSLRFEKIKYTGLGHKEKFLFEKKDDEWRLTGYY